MDLQSSSDGSSWVKRSVIMTHKCYWTHRFSPLFLRRLSSSPVVSKASLRTARPINFGTLPSPEQTSTKPCRYSHVLWIALIRPVLHRLPLHHNFTVDLVDEVKQWVQFASHVVPHPAAETLVAWWIGINDTGDTLNRNVCAPASCSPDRPAYTRTAQLTETEFKAFWEQEMQSLFGAVVRPNSPMLAAHSSPEF